MINIQFLIAPLSLQDAAKLEAFLNENGFKFEHEANNTSSPRPTKSGTLRKARTTVTASHVEAAFRLHEKGLPDREVGAKIGLHGATVNRILHGKTPVQKQFGIRCEKFHQQKEAA